MSFEIWNVSFILRVSFKIWNVSFDSVSPALYEPCAEFETNTENPSCSDCEADDATLQLAAHLALITVSKCSECEWSHQAISSWLRLEISQTTSSLYAAVLSTVCYFFLRASEQSSCYFCYSHEREGIVLPAFSSCEKKSFCVTNFYVRCASGKMTASVQGSLLVCIKGGLFLFTNFTIYRILPKKCACLNKHAPRLLTSPVHISETT